MQQLFAKFYFDSCVRYENESKKVEAVEYETRNLGARLPAETDSKDKQADSTFQHPWQNVQPTLTYVLFSSISVICSLYLL